MELHEILANKPLGTITDHMGRMYNINHSIDKYTFMQVYIPRYRGKVDSWSISKQYDLYFIAGGSRYYILADGTLVHGFNTFPQSELKKIYDLLKPFDKDLNLIYK